MLQTFVRVYASRVRSQEWGGNNCEADLCSLVRELRTVETLSSLATETMQWLMDRIAKRTIEDWRLAEFHILQIENDKQPLYD